MEVPLQHFRDGSDGSSPFTYSAAHRTWLCGDSIGLVHKLTPDATDLAASVNVALSPITALAVCPIDGEDSGSCAVATDSSVSIHAFPDVEHAKVSQAVRCTLPVSHVEYDRAGRHVFVASKEPDIAVYSCRNDCTDCKIKTHETAVRTLAVSPADRYLAHIDSNGSAFIHQLRFESGPQGKKYLGAEQVFRVGEVVDKSFCRDDKLNVKVSWHPRSPVLALPSKNGSIVVLAPSDEENAATATTAVATHSYESKSVASWSEKFLISISDPTLSHDKVDVNLVCFSANGRYLVSSDRKGTILVWDFALRDIEASAPIRKLSCVPSVPLYDIQWGPLADDNYLLVTSMDSWRKISDAIHLGVGLPMPNDLSAPDGTAPKAEDPSSASSGASGSTFKRLQKAGLTTASLLASSGRGLDFLEDGQDSTSASATSGATSAAAGKQSGDKSKGKKSSTGLKKNKKAARSSAADSDDEAEVNEKGSLGTKGKSSGPKVIDDDEDLKQDRGARAMILDEASDAGDVRDNDDNDDGDDGDDQGDDEDDEDDDDLGIGAGASGRKRQKLDSIIKYAKQLVGDGSRTVDPSTLFAPRIQPPFQPSTTKFDERFRKYMVWNHVGNITLRQDGGMNRIEIRFSNTMSNNKQESFQDNLNFCRASLSYEGAIFANDPDSFDPNDPDYLEHPSQFKGSTIYYRAFPGQTHMEGANESFTYTLPHGEGVLGVAAGFGWVAAATSKQLLRLYSSAGVQLSVSYLQGSFICMVGCADHLAIFYHDAVPLGDLNRVAVDVFQIDWKNNRVRSVVSHVAVPLPQQAKLEWAGFDVESHLLTCIDSAGQLKVLTRSHGWVWVPALDIAASKKSVDHIYWPVMVKANKLVFVLLNGESKPAVYPQPVVSVKPFRWGIIEVREGKDKGEAQNERVREVFWQNLFVSHFEATLRDERVRGEVAVDEMEESLANLEREADKAVLKMLQEACRVQKSGLAHDLVHRLRTDNALDIAIRIADQFGMTRLAETVEALKQFREQLQLRLLESAGGEQEEEPEPEQPEPEPEPEPEQQSRGRPGGARMLVRRGDVRRSQGGNVDDEDDDVVFAGEDVGHDTRSPQGPSSGARLGKALDFSQEDQSRLGTPQPVERTPPMNPFAIRNSSPATSMAAASSSSSSSSSSPLKRKSMADSLRDMKSSPSPKKTQLSRLSSFSQQSRLSRKGGDKTLL